MPVHVELCNVKGLCLHGYMRLHVCVAGLILLSGIIQTDRFSGMDDEEETEIPQIFFRSLSISIFLSLSCICSRRCSA